MKLNVGKIIICESIRTQISDHTSNNIQIMSGSRQTELSNLKEFLSYGNKEITMLLQNLQWNRQTLNSVRDSFLLIIRVSIHNFTNYFLTFKRPMVTCSYDGAHKIPNNKLKEHEEYCMLKSQEYSKDEKLFPTFPEDTPTIVKLSMIIFVYNTLFVFKCFSSNF